MEPAAERSTTVGWTIPRRTAILEHTYRARRAGAGDAGVWTAVLGAALLAVLIGLQWFLTRRFRRVLHPSLVLATLATALLTILGVRLFDAEAEHLRVAKIMRSRGPCAARRW